MNAGAQPPGSHERVPPATSAARSERAEGSARDRRLGVWSAALLALAVSATWALTVPAFWGVDETSHVAYAVEAARGNWPTIDTPNPVDGFPGLAERIDYDISFGRLGRLDIWTSNHPPLYFLVAGIPLRLGLLLDHAGAGMVAARLLTALGGAAGVLAVGWLACAIAPRRPRVAVIAAFVTALSPTLVHYAGQIYNDSLGFTLSTLGLAAGFIARRSGANPRLFLIGGVASGAGALTRTSGLAVAAVAGAAFLLAAWFDAAGEQRGARIRATLRAGLVVAGLIVLIAGWAVVVNLVRFGDPTGGGELFEKFDRVEGPPWWVIVTHPRFLIDQVDRFAAELSIGVWWPSFAGQLLWVVLVAAIVGGVAAAVARLRDGDRFGPRGAWIGILTVALPVILLVASAVFISEGGYPHSRYLLPGLGAMAVLLALGLDRLPGAGRGVPALAALVVLAVANVSLWLRFSAEHRSWYQEVFPFADLPLLAPTWVGVSIGAGLAAVALGGIARSVLALSPPPAVPGSDDAGGPGSLVSQQR